MLLWKNPDLDIFYSLIDIQFAMNNTVSTVTGFTPHPAFYGFETVDPIDYSVRLDHNLVSSPITFADELKREIGRRGYLIKQNRELASREMNYTHDRAIARLPQYEIGD